MRQGLWLFLAACLLVVASQIPAEAADYYVATDGDDANPGTVAKPLKDPVKAAARLMPGDTLYFRGGKYVCQTNGIIGLAPSRDGAPGKPITFKNYNNEHVHIDCGRADWGFTSNGFNHIVIDGFEITGPRHYGMKISAHHGRAKRGTGSHVTIRNCEVHHSGSENIFSADTPYLTVENCHLHHSGRSHGLYLAAGCHNAVIRNVTSEENHGNSGTQLNAAGSRPDGIKNALVERCLLRNNAQGYSLMALQDSVFRRNIVYNDCYAGPRDSGYREVILWTYGDKAKGTPGTPCKNVLFEHNTFVNLRPGKINHLFQVKSKSSGIVLRNNLLLVGANRPVFTIAEDSVEGMKMEGNLYCNPAAHQVVFGQRKLPLTDFLTLIKSPGRNLRGDPMLTNPAKGDFTPKPGSPAIDAGVKVAKPDLPFVGKGPDIGAIEVGAKEPIQIGCKLPWKKAKPESGPAKPLDKPVKAK